jgi:glutamine amidotransferase
MGWSRVTPQATDPLLEGMPAGARFYFAHSYHAAGVPTEYILAGAHHGYDFPCMIRCGNVRGAQFHPEKSHRFGLWLLARFCAL